MKFEKTELTELTRCYAAAQTTVDGQDLFLFATEGPGKCLCYTYPGLVEQTVWEEPGGTMSMVPIPGKNGDFLAVQKFLPTFDSKEAMVVWAHRKAEGSWEIKKLIDLPYLHRFDIFSIEGKNYFLGATLCTSKQYKDDWSDPGKIYVGVLPERPEDGMELRAIHEGLTKNHGYTRWTFAGLDHGVVTAQEGVFLVTPPYKGEEWKVEQMLDRPVSDVAFVDVDGDGTDEMVTIEPFHGGNFFIQKKEGDGYRIVYRYPKKMDFAHVVWGGMLCGKPVVIGGYRREGKELFVVSCKAHGQRLLFHTQTIDSFTGPSNVHVARMKGKDIILSANREIGKAALYTVME